MSPLNTDADRRTVLRLIAAGAAAAVASCSRPTETIFPYVDQPEGMLPGTVQRFPTVLPFAGYGRGVTGLVTEGRPIKLEGLATHPASLGATDLFAETSILDLYDPQRLRAPSGPNRSGSWNELGGMLAERFANGDGNGLRLLTGRITSPTLLARIAALKARFPRMRHVRWEPINDDNALAGATKVFGRPLTMRPRFDHADMVLSLGADPLGPGPDQVSWARAWSDRRKAKGRAPSLLAFEPSLTQTGVMADARAAADGETIATVCRALAAELDEQRPAPELPPRIQSLLTRAFAEMRSAHGRTIILAGASQPSEVHAFAAWANARIEAPVDWIEPVDPHPETHGEGLAALAGEMHRGAVDTLVILDADPVYAAPPELDFSGAMKRVDLTLAATRFPSATSAGAHWKLPLSHSLETWADMRAPDGTASIAQPLVGRFYDTRSEIELVDMLMDPTGGPGAASRVRDTWASAGSGDTQWWRGALLAGIIEGTTAAPVAAEPARPIPPIIVRPQQIMLDVIPSPTLWDGCNATNAWAQECPEPITKEVWGTSLRLGAADAKRLDLQDGDPVDVVRGKKRLTLPLRIVPGQVQGIATMLAGYGREQSGPVAKGIGVNAWLLGTGPVTLSAAASPGASAVDTQEQFRIEGEWAKLYPVIAPGEAMPRLPAQASLLPPHANAPTTSPSWGMVIDTSVCIGCNACVVACQAENNVPVIGPEEMAANRDMHWLRIDRYDRGDEDDPKPGFQPVPCMQCETAPCEPVCPVEASVHDAQGLNVQVYNRCIGTRTCQANCPYKVRRFNFLDYTGKGVWGDEDMRSIQAQRNPDVTVRARGVMEKCTYCVQRISAANREAAASGEPIADGAVVTACQSACPTQAITFGDIADPATAVSRQRRDSRHYALLEELGTRPRTTYLARVRKP